MFGSSRQDKELEKLFFNSIAASEHYETTSKELYSYIFSVLSRLGIFPRGSMLEAGCGCGVFGKAFLKHYPNLEVVGVDIADQMVKRANDGITGYNAIVGDLEDSNLFAEGSFDLVLCPFILHHFPDIEIILSNFSKWLRKGGFFVAMEPNGSNPITKFSEWSRKLVGIVFGADFIMRRRFSTPNETFHSVQIYKKILAKNGFNLLCLDPYYFSGGGFRPPSIWWARDILHRVTKRLFPRSVLFGSGILIVAEKK